MEGPRGCPAEPHPGQRNEASPSSGEACYRQLASFGLEPNRSPEEALRMGRYVLEGGERVDVLVARSVSTIDGERVVFDDLWARRRELWLDDHVHVNLPCIDDLIATKRFGARAKDAEDIRYLELLKKEFSA